MDVAARKAGATQEIRDTKLIKLGEGVKKDQRHPVRIAHIKWLKRLERFLKLDKTSSEIVGRTWSYWACRMSRTYEQLHIEYLGLG